MARRAFNEASLDRTLIVVSVLEYVKVQGERDVECDKLKDLEVGEVEEVHCAFALTGRELPPCGSFENGPARLLRYRLRMQTLYGQYNSKVRLVRVQLSALKVAVNGIREQNRVQI